MKPEQLEIERLKRAGQQAEGGAGYPKKHTLSRVRRQDVRLHREAPLDLAGRMAMRCVGRIPVRLPCLAEPIAQRQVPQQRSRPSAGQGELYRQ